MQQPRQLSSLPLPRSGPTLPQHKGQQEDGAGEGWLISTHKVSRDCLVSDRRGAGTPSRRQNSTTRAQVHVR